MPRILSIGSNDINVSIHLLRQFLAGVAVGFLAISGGLALGHSAVLLPQLKQDEAFLYDAKYDSWIASTVPLSSAVGCICAGPIIDRFGRKVGLSATVVPFVIGWIVQGTATTVELMLLGRFFAGLCTGGYMPMALVYLGEVTDPRHRAMALMSVPLLGNVGILMSHLIGSYLFWKLSLLVFCIPVVLSFVLLLYLKESPSWMIIQGKYNKGIELFRWYRAKTVASDKELERVISKQKNSEKLKLKIVFSKPFLKALTISSVLFINIQFCGVNAIHFYTSDILKSTFSDNVDAFLIMIIIDLIQVCANIFIFFGVKYIPRRILFLYCSFGTVVVLLGLIAYTYFNAYGLLWLGLTSMVIYIGFSSIMVSTAWSFLSELYSNNVRALGSAISSTISFLFLFIVVKITPGIIETYGISVVYVGNAVTTFVCSLILCFILPETNKKSLQDIEETLAKNNSIDMTRH